jgi:hypothetical protein
VVWDQLRRRGQLVLVLVLPDGSKKQIPASWTDLGVEPGPGWREDGGDTGPVAPGGGVLASVDDLLHVREVIAGLAVRGVEVAGQAARQSPAKEDDRAAHAAQSAAGPGSGTTNGSGQSVPRIGKVSRDAGSGPADQPGGPGEPGPGHTGSAHADRARVHAAGGEPR